MVVQVSGRLRQEDPMVKPVGTLVRSCLKIKNKRRARNVSQCEVCRVQSSILRCGGRKKAGGTRSKKHKS